MSVQNALCRRLLTTRPPVLRGHTVPQYQKKEKRMDVSVIRNNGSRFLLISRCPHRLLEHAGVGMGSLPTSGLLDCLLVSLVSWGDRAPQDFPGSPQSYD